MTTCIHIPWVDDCTFIRLVAFSSVFFEYLFLLLASTFCLFHCIGEGVWGWLYLFWDEGLGVHDHSFYISLFTFKKGSRHHCHKNYRSLYRFPYPSSFVSVCGFVVVSMIGFFHLRSPLGSSPRTWLLAESVSFERYELCCN